MLTHRPSRTHVALRVLGALSLLAGAWAVLLWLTGGFHYEFGGFRLSSRRPRNAFVISLVCAVLVWMLRFSPGGRQAFDDEWSRWRRWFESTRASRSRGSRVLRIAVSSLTVAIVAIAVDIYQWRAALPFWVDEEMIALNLRDRAVSDLAGALWLGQSAPFGWLVLERAAMAVLGTGEAAMRALPLFFGLATIGAAVWVGRRWMGHMAAVMFVLLCWIGPFVAHYRFEVKHYTADVFFGLLLPCLAAWAIEAETNDERMRRVWFWWCAAAVGHWFANGALIVSPACAAVLCAAVWRRDGSRAALWSSIGGVLWAGSFVLHYLISIRHTLTSTFLRTTWAAELLPPSLGVTGTLRWLLDRVEPLAFNPGGTTLWLAFWGSAICGWALTRRRSLGIALAVVPLSAFAAAAVVPLHQRFSIWIVPALYAGVALLIDRGVAAARDGVVRRQWAVLTIAAVVLYIQFRLVSDILTRGRVELTVRHGSTEKHQLDDRAAVRWLMSQSEPGDALVAMHLTLPAVWWYGMIPISDAAGSGSVLPGGGAVYEVAPTADCSARQLEGALKHHRRVLLYLGFDVVPGFDVVLLRSLGELGGMTAHRDFATLGRAAVIDRRQPPSDSITRLHRHRPTEELDSGACVSVQRAARW